MFKRVLVATDFSAHADHTLECIGEIPGMEEILLVHVIGESVKNEKSFLNHSSHHSALETAVATLEEKRDHLMELTGVSVVSRIVESVDGDTAGAIVRLAQKENISLIVMGGRGHGLLYGYILGSVSEAVIQRSDKDILIMHFRGSDNPDGKNLEKFCRNIFSHVLCPVDFSRPSVKTVEYAAGLGGVRRMTLLHVLDSGASEEDLPPLQEQSRRQLDQIVADLHGKGIQVSSLVRSGHPAQMIAGVAEDLDVSLIMIARVGQSDYAKNIPLGRVVAGVVASAERPMFIVNPHVSLDVRVRELDSGEFALAEQLWLDYHQQKADSAIDRVFGVFVEGTLAAAARCRRHPDGLEVDAVFVPPYYRERGYARLAVQALVDACGNEPLFMHATLDLVTFYSTFGFSPIGEHELPRTIMERFSFADGDLEGANVLPMKRVPALPGRSP
jgi:nucleotide-binding universal stress UspA family protein